MNAFPESILFTNHWRPAMSFKGTVMSVDDVAIHYEVSGQGTPTLVFVHGFTSNRSYWKEQVAYFARQHQVVTLDLAGHGESGQNRENWTMEAFGKDVASVVDKLDLKSVVLVGHSMGGSVMVEAALAMPDRVIGLVAADTFRDLEQDPTPEQANAFLAPFRADFASAMRELVGTVFTSTTDPALVERVTRDATTFPPQIGAETYSALYLNIPNLRKKLRALAAPIFAINSDYRPNNVTGAKRYGVEMTLMSQVGHMVMMEDSETFNRLLSGFLAKFPNPPDMDLVAL
jgi:pimeloyl-ACP methyl ester carboxylesterase